MIFLLMGFAFMALLSTLVAGVDSVRLKPDSRYRKAFISLFIAGCAVAVWCTFFYHYSHGGQMQIYGFPFADRIVVLKKGTWVSFPGGSPIYYLINFLVVTATVELPMSIALLVRRWRRFRSDLLRFNNYCPCGYDLRMSPARCPECGLAVSTGNPVPSGAVQSYALLRSMWWRKRRD